MIRSRNNEILITKCCHWFRILKLLFTSAAMFEISMFIFSYFFKTNLIMQSTSMITLDSWKYINRCLVELWIHFDHKIIPRTIFWTFMEDVVKWCFQYTHVFIWMINWLSYLGYQSTVTTTKVSWVGQGVKGYWP